MPKLLCTFEFVCVCVIERKSARARKKLCVCVATIGEAAMQNECYLFMKIPLSSIQILNQILENEILNETHIRLVFGCARSSNAFDCTFSYLLLLTHPSKCLFFDYSLARWLAQT